MAALPYIQLYVADYLADTAHLNAAQHGAYLLLIMNYWQKGKPLDNRNERLANVARMSNEEWQQNKDAIAEFFVIDGETWNHPRIDADLDAVMSKSTKNSNAGKASAAAKALKRKLFEKEVNERSADVEQVFNHTDTDTDTDTEENIKTEQKIKAEENLNEDILFFLPPENETIKPAKQKKQKSLEITFPQFIEKCLNENADPIPANHPVVRWAEASRIPENFVVIAWEAFKAKHVNEHKKRQADWPATFYNYCKLDYLKVWSFDREGTPYLTTAGKNFEKGLTCER